MFYCWHGDPEERPSFGELVRVLSDVIEGGEDYIRMDLYPEHCYYNVVMETEGEKV